tara:strand:+ start:34823 stop:35803 length:981 start_codon:yes stop_codon:yes gene_type:complete
MSVFADAYQKMLGSQGKGGGLTGQAAIAALLEAVPTGKVSSNDLLPFVSEEMQRRAAPKLDIAMRTSQAWQGRFQSQANDWTKIASESGLEAGMKNFFETFTLMLRDNPQIAQAFGSGWESFSKGATNVMQFPGQFLGAAEGRDNYISAILGDEQVVQLRKNLDELTEAFAIASQKFVPVKSWWDDFSLVKTFSGTGAKLTDVGGDASRFLRTGELGTQGLMGLPQNALDLTAGTLYNVAGGEGRLSEAVYDGGLMAQNRALLESQKERNIGSYLNEMTNNAPPVMTMYFGDIIMEKGAEDPDEFVRQITYKMYDAMRDAKMPNNR